MIKMEIEIERNSEGDWSITCPVLSLYSQAKTLDSAIDDLQDTINVVASEYPDDARKINIDPKSKALFFSDSVEMLPFIFKQMRQTSGKTLHEMKEELSLNSVGAVTKYFNPKNKTIPNVKKFCDLIESFGHDIYIK
jgi:predicted RNase H-like HicB family nuclease